MGYYSLTPFGRTAKSVRAALTPAQPREPRPCPLDKWQILRDLTEARASFGLSDRDMTVLQALLSCHPHPVLDGSGPLVVHPSNETICARANGMACSTMRRHLAKLVSGGFLHRRDSPNGKRYVRRVAGAKIAFGFDLSPLLHRATEISQAAAACRETAAQRDAHRETVSLLRRDLAALLDLLGASDRPALPAHQDLLKNTTRALRRKLTIEDLEQIEPLLRQAIRETAAMLDLESSVLSTSSAPNEQHQQSDKKDSFESRATEPLADTPQKSVISGEADAGEFAENSAATPPPFYLLRERCTEIAVFAPDPISDWRSLVRATDLVRPMTGITESIWHEAKSVMGAKQAAGALCAMLQKFSSIRNPNGYLRSLILRAREGSFSLTRMVLALGPAPG
ncbi:plasmid replication protein RepC [Limimaricola soesokkakensis]|uniref:plasmid replication protein RepC n=1 Tax=Limimaricola soesokkakensis TaxID=1343159 RepID=UPI00351638E5